MSDDEKVEQSESGVPDPPAWATTPKPPNGRAPGGLVSRPEAEFPLALRGYDRHAVDEYVEEVGRVVGELESRRMREPAVRRALEEVGEQTSEILRQAHETADEIAARSRAQAEGRLQRAEDEAAAIRRDAETAARLLAKDNQRLWEQRRELIEEIRALADDVLALADNAAERLPPPEIQGTPETGEAEETLALEPAPAGEPEEDLRPEPGQGASRSTVQPPPGPTE